MDSVKGLAVQHINDDIEGNDKLAASNVAGTVRLADDKTIFLFPAPSADPRDPLNMKKWRKVLFVVIVSVYSCAAGSMVSGFGSLLPFYRPTYLKQGVSASSISGLVAFPPLFMGLGNLIFVPVANAIGRRPVFLLVCLITILGAVISSRSTTFQTHLAGRMVLGLGAGLGEALPPMMVSEIHFIHERSTALMWQSGIQAIGAAIFVLCASPIAGAVGPDNWYLIGIGFVCAVFLAAIFFVPESKYHRQEAATTGHDHTDLTHSKLSSRPVRLEDRPALDTVHYRPRTMWSDMDLFVNPMEWRGIVTTLTQMVKLFFFPTVFWAFVLNGTALGAMISISATQATILISTPYNWNPNSVSYVNAGQIVVGIMAIPLLGYGSDWIIKWKARRNNGIHEAESRLIPLMIPLSVGILALLLYGFAGQYPDKIHWGALIFAVPADFFSFVGSNIAAITYLLDSFPSEQAGPLLILITAVRGFVGFGFSYSVTDFVSVAGYAGCFGTFASINFFLGMVGVLIFFKGKSVRRWQSKFL